MISSSSNWVQKRPNCDDSERSDECIDFTMIPSLKRKLNLVGTLGEQKLKMFNIFEMNREKPKKNEGKTGFFTQNQFTSKSNFLFRYNSKTNRCKYLKFSPNVYISALRTQQLKFSIFLIVLKVIKKNPKSFVTNFFYKFLKFEFIRNMSKLRKFAILKIWYKVLHKFFFKYLVDKIFLAQSKYLHNFFLLAFEVQILTKIR
ncbi:hypothetical protein AGLY_003502 [Aphis glycines]|uniref:Uncharacterized protein n=1 Tax=Aphis glycines TaxID=307491 RepID=A0A6G0TZV6_APHGL|nr:hypothetical protein AGLY_003502 [Aphis glycines]